MTTRWAARYVSTLPVCCSLSCDLSELVLVPEQLVVQLAALVLQVEVEMPSQFQLRQLEESIQVMEENQVELINIPVPEFEDGDSAQIVHDFGRVRRSGTSRSTGSGGSAASCFNHTSVVLIY